MQGRPFREGIRENSALYWGLVGASCVAVSGATDFIPELNRWLQVVEMDNAVSPRSFDPTLLSANPHKVQTPSDRIYGY